MTEHLLQLLDLGHATEVGADLGGPLEVGLGCGQGGELEVLCRLKVRVVGMQRCIRRWVVIRIGDGFG